MWCMNTLLSHHIHHIYIVIHDPWILVIWAIYKHLWSIIIASLKHLESIFEVSMKHFWGIFEASWKHLWSIFVASLNLFWSIFQSCRLSRIAGLFLIVKSRQISEWWTWSIAAELCHVIQLTQMLQCYITTVLMDITHLSAKLNLLLALVQISALILYFTESSTSTSLLKNILQFSLKLNSM